MRPPWILIATIVILVLALGVRLGHLSSWPLNNDEIMEATWSSLPFSEMMKEVRRDAVHRIGRSGIAWLDPAISWSRRSRDDGCDMRSNSCSGSGDL